jgi:hypothetical protein
MLKRHSDRQEPGLSLLSWWDCSQSIPHLVVFLKRKQKDVQKKRGSFNEPNTKVVYFESRKRELKKRRKNEDRCDERLKT